MSQKGVIADMISSTWCIGKTCLKNGHGPGQWAWEKTDPLKNGPVGKTGHQGLK